ncbi:hypothetical protein HPULCUR_005487 [Helicostylum pulchrum]|uniref:Methionine--tRNA ligase n=1 Tax=Helicostylum pulchrum TaxID=562976 RepID=A0ABP9Y043_9FUNG
MDLAGQLGNLLNRTTAKALIHNGILPVKHDSVVDPSDESVHQIIAELADNEPWNLVKNPDEKKRLDTVLFYSLEACRIAGILLQPVMPTKMERLLTRLGVSESDRYFKDACKLTQTERPLGEIDGVLFPRLK